MIQLVAGFKAFHSVISKTKFGTQDMTSSDSVNELLISNMFGRGNESRRGKIQKILRLRCLNNSICLKISEQVFHPRTFRFIGKFGRDRWMRHFMFDKQLRLNVDLQIIILKSCPFDLLWRIQILPHRAWRRGVIWCWLFDLHRPIAMSPPGRRVHLISTVITP